MKVIFNESCFFKQISIFTINSGIPLHVTVVPQSTTGTTGKKSNVFFNRDYKSYFRRKKSVFGGLDGFRSKTPIFVRKNFGAMLKSIYPEWVVYIHH